MQGSACLQGEVGLSDFNFRVTTLEQKTFFNRVIAYLQSNVRVKICHSTQRFLALFSLFVAVFFLKEPTRPLLQVQKITFIKSQKLKNL